MNDLALLQQLVARWKAKSPKVFIYITYFSGIVAFVAGVPQLISDLGITLPATLAALASKPIAAAAAYGGLVAKLTVATPEATQQILSSTTPIEKPVGEVKVVYTKEESTGANTTQ